MQDGNGTETSTSAPGAATSLVPSHLQMLLYLFASTGHKYSTCAEHEILKIRTKLIAVLSQATQTDFEADRSTQTTPLGLVRMAESVHDQWQGFKNSTLFKIITAYKVHLSGCLFITGIILLVMGFKLFQTLDYLLFCDYQLGVNVLIAKDNITHIARILMVMAVAFLCIFVTFSCHLCITSTQQQMASVPELHLNQHRIQSIQAQSRPIRLQEWKVQPVN